MNVVPWLIDGDDEFPSARIKSVEEAERYDLESGACLKSQQHSDDFDRSSNVSCIGDECQRVTHVKCSGKHHYLMYVRSYMLNTIPE